MSRSFLLVSYSAAVVLIAGFGGFSAPASAKRVDYNVVHTVTLKPKDENTVWKAGWAYGARASASNSIPEKSTPKPLKGVVEPFTNAGTVTLPAAVSWANSAGTAAATGSGAKGGVYNGTITAKGFAEVEPPQGESARAFASSISTLGVRTGQTKGNGVIRWGQAVYVQSVGCTGPCGQGRDPIDFDVTNLTSLETLTGRFIDIDLWINGGTGTLSLVDGVLGFSSDQMNPLSGSVLVDISSPYSLQQGQFLLNFVDGIVTGGVATGQFAGLLPEIGIGIGGSINLGSLDIDYDFGWGESAVAMGLGFGNAGLARVAEGIPEPASWAMMLIGFGIVGAAVRHRRQASPAS